MVGSRPRIVIGSVVAALALSAVAAQAAGDQVPKLTNLRASPNHFCAKSSDSCARPGTTIRFHLSTDAKVIGDIRPRKRNIQGYTDIRGKFKAGANSVRLNDSRLTPGRWTLKMQPINSVGANGPTLLDVHVIE